MAIEKVAVSRVEIEDKPGALEEVLAGVAGANVNILHLAAFSIGGGLGEAYIVPADREKFIEYASSKGMDPAEYSGFLLTGADKIGVGAEVTRPVADAGVNIVLNIATVSAGEYAMLMVVEERDADKAAAALGA